MAQCRAPVWEGLGLIIARAEGHSRTESHRRLKQNNGSILSASDNVERSLGKAECFFVTATRLFSVFLFFLLSSYLLLFSFSFFVFHVFSSLSLSFSLSLSLAHFFLRGNDFLGEWV